MRATAGVVVLVLALVALVLALATDRRIGERGWGFPAWHGTSWGPLALGLAIVAGWLLGWMK